MSRAAGTPPETLELIADRLVVERMTGIEPASSAWKADILPLNYIRISVRAAGLEPTPLAASASLAGLRFHSQSIANMTQTHRLPLYLLSYARIFPLDLLSDIKPDRQQPSRSSRRRHTTNGSCTVLRHMGCRAARYKKEDYSMNPVRGAPPHGCRAGIKIEKEVRTRRLILISTSSVLHSSG